MARRDRHHRSSCVVRRRLGRVAREPFARRRPARCRARRASATRRRRPTPRRRSSLDVDRARSRRAANVPTRRARRSAAGSCARRGGEVVEYEPVDEEELGVTRRQFLNRGIADRGRFRPRRLRRRDARVPVAVAGSTGFGGKVNVGKLCRHPDYIDTQPKPFYVPQARTYVEPYPKDPQTLAEREEGLQARRSIERHGSRASSRCTSAACTSGAACRSARSRSGSSARATVRSTTASARRRPARRRVASTASTMTSTAAA